MESNIVLMSFFYFTNSITLHLIKIDLAGMSRKKVNTDQGIYTDYVKQF